MGIVIHASTAVGWQMPFARKMQAGLKTLGITAPISTQRSRCSDKAILCGTTLWRNIESDGDYLLVDRCSFGNTDEWVSLVWNGHGRRGDHCVPGNTNNRWHKFRDDFPIKPWRFSGNRVVLCGQTETYSPHYEMLEDWYGLESITDRATHFRKHPAGNNPTGLPSAQDWRDVGLAITLNSSIAVESVMNGVPTVAMDEAAMAWPVTSHYTHIACIYDRDSWLEWLSWTQWHHDEIEAGKPIKHLFEAL